MFIFWVIIQAQQKLLVSGKLIAIGAFMLSFKKSNQVLSKESFVS